MAAEQAERDKRVWIASRDGDVEELRAALEAGGDPNSKPEDDGDAAIHVAVAGHHTDVVRVLAESGADVNVVDAFGAVPLYRAASEKGCEEIISVLVKAGANVDFQNVELDGNATALHAAAFTALPLNVSTLLACGASDSLRDEDGNTALDVAKAEGHAECAKAFIRHAVARATSEGQASEAGGAGGDSSTASKK